MRHERGIWRRAISVPEAVRLVAMVCGGNRLDRFGVDRLPVERRMSNEVVFILLMLPIALCSIIIGGAIIVSH